MERRLEEQFTKTEGGYEPKDPGRQEYRKCGVKDGRLVLQLEEALFELGLPEDALSEYAQQHGYAFFLAYKGIRDAGWILLPRPHARFRYMYDMHRPDKHFNRKTAAPGDLLQFVAPGDAVDPEAFSAADGGRVVFAIAEGRACALVEGTAEPSAPKLVENYAAVQKR